jgi:hypothetical protein
MHEVMTLKSQRKSTTEEHKKIFSETKMKRKGVS